MYLNLLPQIYFYQNAVLLIIIITFFPRALARLRQLDQTRADGICLSYTKADGIDYPSMISKFETCQRVSE